MSQSIKELERQLQQLTIQKREIEQKLHELILSVIDDISNQTPHHIRKITSNCFVIKASELVGGPWSPQFYDWGEAVDLVIKFLEAKPVETWKSELQKKLDESNGRQIEFVHTYHCNGLRYKNSYPVDPEFIKKIINKI